MNKLFISLSCLTLMATSCRFEENKKENISSGEHTTIASSASQSTETTQSEGIVNGDTKTFSNTNFSELTISSAFDVQLTQGNEYSVKAIGNQKDLEDVAVVQKGDELQISVKALRRVQNIKLQITLPSLRELDISGAVTAKATNEFTAANDFSADVSGASTLTMPLTAVNASFDISGAANVNVTGKVNKLNLDVAGGSHVDMQQLVANEADIEASGASTVKANVTGSIEAEASGASTIEYTGNPNVKKSETSGASKIKSL